ncbi:MAG: GLPGLI family protein [Lentimicrobiaceae bacterium]|jgi:GLPGLI family protein|nr:GLPGLI family protein [Lentimicrobiaceae bacterium]
MKTIPTLIGSIILFSGFLCQAQDPVLFNIMYEFEYVRDLADKENPFTDKMILSVGKNSSRYISEKMYNQLQREQNTDNADKALVGEQGLGQKMAVSGGPLLMVNNNNVVIDEQILKDFENKKLTVWGFMGPKDYRTETNLPKIEWQILDEKKTIGNYNCQKASGSYGGRLYDVWFTQDLPLQDGPWKLSGLPGLILEARDSRNEVIFTFIEIIKPQEGKETTASFFKDDKRFTVVTTPSRYNKIKKAYETDPESMWSAAFPDAKLSVINSDNTQATRSNTIKTYNPMEIK